MESQDIRWKQRFMNYQKALHQLSRFMELDTLNEFEKQGLIKSFEYTHELAWNVMKDFLKEQGIQGIIGSKDATRYAFQNELIAEGEIWMEMIESRNKTVHTYDVVLADDIVSRIISFYFQAFKNFESKMTI